MKVAVVGGTGKFGQAVAKRLVDAGVEVVIGSRDAERARETAAALGATGANNDDAVRGVDLVVFAVNADAAVETARDLRQSIGSTPVLSVCAELEFGPGGVKPDGGADVDREADRGRARRARRRRPALARGRQSRRRAARRGRARLRRRRARRRSSRSSSPRGSSPAGPSTAARSPAPARSRG